MRPASISAIWATPIAFIAVASGGRLSAKRLYLLHRAALHHRLKTTIDAIMQHRPFRQDDEFLRPVGVDNHRAPGLLEIPDRFPRRLKHFKRPDDTLPVPGWSVSAMAGSRPASSA